MPKAQKVWSERYLFDLRFFDELDHQLIGLAVVELGWARLIVLNGFADNENRQ